MNDDEFTDFMLKTDDDKNGMIDYEELLVAFKPLLLSLQIKNLTNQRSSKPVAPTFEQTPKKSNENADGTAITQNTPSIIDNLGKHLKQFERRKSLANVIIKGNEGAKTKLESYTKKKGTHQEEYMCNCGTQNCSDPNCGHLKNYLEMKNFYENEDKTCTTGIVKDEKYKQKLLKDIKRDSKRNSKLIVKEDQEKLDLKSIDNNENFFPDENILSKMAIKDLDSTKQKLSGENSPKSEAKFRIKSSAQNSTRNDVNKEGRKSIFSKQDMVKKNSSEGNKAIHTSLIPQLNEFVNNSDKFDYFDRFSATGVQELVQFVKAEKDNQNYVTLCCDKYIKTAQNFIRFKQKLRENVNDFEQEMAGYQEMYTGYLNKMNKKNPNNKNYTTLNQVGLSPTQKNSIVKRLKSLPKLETFSSRVITQTDVQNPYKIETFSPKYSSSKNFKHRTFERSFDSPQDKNASNVVKLKTGNSLRHAPITNMRLESSSSDKYCMSQNYKKTARTSKFYECDINNRNKQSVALNLNDDNLVEFHDTKFDNNVMPVIRKEKKSNSVHLNQSDNESLDSLKQKDVNKIVENTRKSSFFSPRNLSKKQLGNVGQKGYVEDFSINGLVQGEKGKKVLPKSNSQAGSCKVEGNYPTNSIFKNFKDNKESS